MFLDSQSNPTFQPTINRRSKHVASALTPLVERQFSEQALRKSRLEKLSEHLNKERSKEATYVPKLSKAPSYLNTDERVPLTERAPPSRSAGPLPDPEATYKPKINEVSKFVAADSNVQNEMAIKRRVRELWQAHAEGPSMSLKGALQVLATFGVTDSVNPDLVDKFLAAMNVDEEDEERRYVQYDRFLKVMASVVRAASAHKPSSAPVSQNKVDANPSSTFRDGAQHHVQLPQKTNTLRRSNSSSVARAFSVDDDSSEEAYPLSHKGPAHLTYFRKEDATTASPSPQAPRQLNRRSMSASPAAPKPTVHHDPHALEPTPQKQLQVKDSASPAPRPIEPQTPMSANNKKATNIPTFRPTINPQSYSEMISARREQEGGLGRSRVSEKSAQRQQQLELEMRRKEMEGCSFAPRTLSGIDPKVSGLLSAARSRSLSQHQGQKQTKSLSNETRTEGSADQNGLSPSPRNVGSTRRANSTSAPRTQSQDPFADPPGFDKIVRRLAEGRARAVPKFEDALRAKSGQDSQSAPEPTDPKPFHLVLEARHSEREQRKPLLYVDVKLPHGKSGRIGIYKGDDPKVLAHNFCVTYGLDTDTLAQLTTMLQQKIDITLRANAIRKVWA